MLNTIFRRPEETHRRLPQVAIVAGRDRRTVLKRVLAGNAEIVAELESDARIHLLREVNPDFVFVDTESPGVNSYLACKQVVESGTRTAVVLLCHEQSIGAAIRRRGAGNEHVVAVHAQDAASVLPAPRSCEPRWQNLSTHAAV